MNLFRLTRRRGILNTFLLFIATFGIMASIITFVFMQDLRMPTASDIAESRKEATPFDALTETQLQEGTMVEGKILYNMGDFSTSYNDNVHYTHHAILLGDKVMSIAIEDVRDNAFMHSQASNYKQILTQNELSIWQYHEDNNSSKNKKKKSKKNKKTVKQVIQENMQYESGIAFKGKIVKMDSKTEDALKNFVIPPEKTKPAFEIIPYEIKCIEPVSIPELIFVFAIPILEAIFGIAALILYIVRMRAHKYFP